MTVLNRGDWTHCRVSVTGGLADRGGEQGHLVLDGLALSNDRVSSGYTSAYSLCPDPTADGTADNGALPRAPQKQQTGLGDLYELV